MKDNLKPSVKLLYLDESEKLMSVSAIFGSYSASHKTTEELVEKAFRINENDPDKDFDYKRFIKAHVKGDKHYSLMDHPPIFMYFENISNVAVKVLEDCNFVFKKMALGVMEKSTRFLNFSNERFHYYPGNFLNDMSSEIKQKYDEIFNLHMDFYTKMKDLYKNLLNSIETSEVKEKHSKLALDSARYFLPYGVTTTCGITFSARSLKRKIIEMITSDVKECVDIGMSMLEIVKNKFPYMFDESEIIIEASDTTRFIDEMKKSCMDILEKHINGELEKKLNTYEVSVLFSFISQIGVSNYLSIDIVNYLNCEENKTKRKLDVIKKFFLNRFYRDGSKKTIDSYTKMGFRNYEINPKRLIKTESTKYIYEKLEDMIYDSLEKINKKYIEKNSGKTIIPEKALQLLDFIKTDLIKYSVSGDIGSFRDVHRNRGLSVGFYPLIAPFEIDMNSINIINYIKGGISEMSKNPIENKYSLFNIYIFSTPIDNYVLESYNLQILEDEYNEKIKELNAKIEQFMKIKIEHKNKINNEINNLIKMFIEEYININKRDFDAPTNEDISLPFALQLSELLFREIREMVTYLVPFGSEIEYVFSGTYSSYIEFVKNRTGSGAHTAYSTLAKNLYDSINNNKKLENLNYINKDLSINEEKVFKNASINDLFESLTKAITD